MAGWLPAAWLLGGLGLDVCSVESGVGDNHCMHDCNLRPMKACMASTHANTLRELLTVVAFGLNARAIRMPVRR